MYGEKDDKQDEIIAAQLYVDTEAFLELAQEKGIKINDDLIHETISKEVDLVNSKITAYKRIIRFHIRENEFEKTTTQKIKRYLVKS